MPSHGSHEFDLLWNWPAGHCVWQELPTSNKPDPHDKHSALFLHSVHPGEQGLQCVVSKSPK